MSCTERLSWTRHMRGWMMQILDMNHATCEIDQNSWPIKWHLSHLITHFACTHRFVTSLCVGEKLWHMTARLLFYIHAPDIFVIEAQNALLWTYQCRCNSLGSKSGPRDMSFVHGCLWSIFPCSKGPASSGRVYQLKLSTITYIYRTLMENISCVNCSHQRSHTCAMVREKSNSNKKAR